MNNDYGRVEKAIHFIQSNLKTQPDLETIASHVGLSPFHFQRLFRRWAGISPKQFLEYLTVCHAKELLSKSNSIQEVSYDLGLSSAGRLHDQFISIEAMTPGQYKAQGRGLKIHYGIHDSPFGSMLLAQSDRGICALFFVTDKSVSDDIVSLQEVWPHAEIKEDSGYTKAMVDKIFERSPEHHDDKIHLMVRGTNFQVNVWKALLNVPAGQISSYQQIARLVKKPTATRAVARAIAANPISYLIPCHRVLRSSGEIGGYRWGVSRKQAMLAWEAARFDVVPNV